MLPAAWCPALSVLSCRSIVGTCKTADCVHIAVMEGRNSAANGWKVKHRQQLARLTCDASFGLVDNVAKAGSLYT